MSVNVVNKSTGELIQVAGKPIQDASNINYNNTTSGLVSTKVQGAIDEVNSNLTSKQDKTDNTLQTTSKTVVGGINELKSGLTTLDNEVNGDATTYPYADVITIEDAIPANLADCKVKIEPVQDLHGFDHPWVGGAGKNIFINSNQTYQNAEAASHVFSNERILGTATGTYYLSFEYKVLTASGNSQSLFYGKYNGSRISGGNISNWVDSTVSSDWISKSFTLNLGNNVIDGIELFSNNVLAVRNIMISATPITAFEPYENICPITGHTEASVKSTGNLCQAWFSGTRYDNGTINLVNTRVISNYIDIEEGTYTISAYTKATGKTVEIACNTWVNKTEGTNERTSDTGFQTNPYTISYDSNKIFSVGLRYSDNSTIDPDDITLMVERGDTAHPYVPYQAPSSATITFGEEVYGGTVDFDSGVMTVDRAVVDCKDINLVHGTSAGGFDWYDMSTPLSLVPKSNTLQYKPNSTDGWNSDIPCLSSNNNNKLRIYGSNSLFANGGDYEGTQVCYELATPTTIQLTPQQIQLLKGHNTLTASTGQISVAVNGVSGSIGQVQEQVNELAEDVALKQNATDNNLQTTDKTIVGGINEVKSGLTNLTDVVGWGVDGGNELIPRANGEKNGVTFTRVYDNTGYVVSYSLSGATTQANTSVFMYYFPVKDSATDYKVKVFNMPSTASHIIWDDTSSSIIPLGTGVITVPANHGVLIGMYVATSGIDVTGGNVQIMATTNTNDPMATYYPTRPVIGKAVADMESVLTNKTGAFSLENDVTAIRNLLVKSVNTVELCGMYQLTLTLGIWNKIGTLPSGYIPMAESRFIARNSTLDKWMLGKMDTDGGVYVYPTADDSQAAQTNVAIQQVFITN